MLIRIVKNKKKMKVNEWKDRSNRKNGDKTEENEDRPEI